MRRLFFVLVVMVGLGLVQLARPETTYAEICQNGVEVDSCSSIGQQPASTGAVGCRTSFLGLPTWYKYLEVGEDEETGDPCAIIGPASTSSSGQDDDSETERDESVVYGIDWGKASGYIGLAVIEILLRIATFASIGFVMYGGFRYITSQGDPESAKSARQTIINSLIGLVISLLATGIVVFIGSVLIS